MGVCQRTATGLAEGLRSGDLSSEALTSACLSVVRGSSLNAFISVAEDEALAPDPEFPMILVAGWHYDYNANTTMRDPAWNGNRRTGCLAVNPQDATALGMADGEFGKLTTKAGSATVEVEVSNLTTPGMVLLPQGFGLTFDGRTVGVNVNQLTHADHRDPISAVPCHRWVPCRLEKSGH